MQVAQNTRAFRMVLLFTLIALPLQNSTAAPSSAASGLVRLSPNAYITETGASGGEPVGNLALMDQSGTNDNPAAYVTFTTPGVAYQGYRTFTLPGNISREKVVTLGILVNYKGPARVSQTWTWYLYDWSARSWIAVGNNNLAASRTW